MTAAGAIAIVIVIVVVLLVVGVASRAVRMVPQARARNVERLGRYRKTLEPGLNIVIPMIDRVKPLIDLREQVVSFSGQRVITEDNLVVTIDTVLFFQVTDPRAADYEIVNYIQAIEQLTATMLRSVIGSMDLEQTLTSREGINTMLRGVLDDASGKWGIRVTRVEIKAIDPPKSVIDAMEKQMRAEREKRAAILTAEGVRQAQILTADGDKQGNVLRAEGEKQSAILKAEGQAQAISTVFSSIHEGDPDPKLLAYQYLQTLPQLAQGQGNTVWMIPSELTGALKMLGEAFQPSAASDDVPPVTGQARRAVAKGAAAIAYQAGRGVTDGSPASADEARAVTDGGAASADAARAAAGAAASADEAGLAATGSAAAVADEAWPPVARDAAAVAEGAWLPATGAAAASPEQGGHTVGGAADPAPHVG